MCDSTDSQEQQQQQEQPSGRKRATSKPCIKCKTAQPSVAIRLSVYCKDCFVKSAIVKFRSALSKSRKRAPVSRTKVMVALSGGATSSAMLRLMDDYQHMELKGAAAEPIYAGVVVGHVDESTVFSGYEDTQICAIATDCGVDVVVARLEDVFVPDSDQPALLELVHATIAPSASRDQFCVQLAKNDGATPGRERLRALFAGLGSATDREDMLDILKTFLLTRLARQAQCELLLMGDSGTRIAAKLVSLTSRGRGFSLPLEIGAESRLAGGVTVYRPMRDYIMKEIAFFNLWTKQRSVVVPTFTTGAPTTASIDRLTEAFVVGLDRDFPSTVSTVCRTVQKLELREDALDALPCIVCNLPAEPNAQVWRNRLTVSEAPNAQPALSNASAALVTDVKAQHQSPFDVTAHLCYSCQSLLHFAKPGLALPAFCFETYREHVKTAANSTSNDWHQRQETLRRQIEEFLL
ncbi:Cytoplasmic tRNA 2-thiolation protein 2 [Coemansia thaxteri]|uniref:Cytoplasmic tRNA 2-thiolation protein 2 n=1 Tax=Coemansia thaxteri TaxID=2663907 RepID=A0A9W8BGA1_9FUNG|nr:Cytoplasmic tRNA 2-thiolation protein 2 [Coemansia thaxteri]